MKFNASLLLPLVCALTYVLGALAVKRANAFGVGIWRTSFLSNVAIALLFVPVWFGYGGQVHPLADYWQPAVSALLHLGGESRQRHVGRTVLLATGSATLFSLGDVLLQKWVPVWGQGNYFPPMFLIVALMSCAFVPFFHAPLTAMPAAAWRWVGPGALLLALNNAGVVLAIMLVGSATVVNIIYSVRGLFSVLLVWLIGHWFTNEEKDLGGRVLRLRLAGAGLMVAAIVLVLI